MAQYSSITLILCLILTFSTYSRDEHNSKAFRKGQRFYERGNFSEAKKIFEELLTSNSDNASINFYLGASKMALKDYEGALINFRAIYDISKGQPEVLVDVYYLAYLYHVTHRFYEAIRMYHILLNRMIKDKTETIYLPDKQLSLESKDIKRRIHQCRFAQSQVKHPIKVSIKRLSDNINGPWPESRPLISGSESILIFTSRRPHDSDRRALDGLPYQDIFISERQPNGEWQPVVPLDSGLVNTPDHNTAVTISNDGTEIFTSTTNFNFMRGELADLSFSNLINNEWTAPILLPDAINSDYWEGGASMTADGKMIFFTSNRPGGYGGTDLYLSKFDDGYWKNATNLGNTVNTELDEKAPYINADASVLYFASEGHENMGGFDIFTADYNAEYDKWKNVKNIGYPINTAADEIHFAWTPDGSKAYFSAVRPDSKGFSDLYSLELEQPRFNFITFQGYIYDSESQQPLSATLRIYDIQARNLVEEKIINNKAGRYIFTLAPDKSYGIYISAAGYLFKSYHIQGALQGKSISRNQNIYLKKMSPGQSEELENMFFNPDGNYIENLSYYDLVAIQKLAHRYKNHKLSLTLGYACPTVDNSDVKAILDRNILTVQAALKKLHVSEQDLEVRTQLQKADNTFRFNRYTIISGKNTGSKANSLINRAELEQQVIEKGQVLLAEVIRFEHNNDARYDKDFPVILAKIKFFLAKYPNMIVEVAGYTDSEGNPDYNLQISKQRADFIRQELIKQGIKAERLIAKGYGEANPISTNNAEADRRRNRRIEFKVASLDN